MGDGRKVVGARGSGFIYAMGAGSCTVLAALWSEVLPGDSKVR